MKKSFVSLKSIVLFVLAVCVVLCGFFAYFFLWGSSCGKLVFDQNIEDFATKINEFSSVERIASSTSRIALSAPLQRMQTIRDETAALKVVKCLENAQSLLVGSFDRVIIAYLSFMDMESDSVIVMYFDFAKNKMDEFVAEVEAVKLCAPFCK